jgi:hypothetical protein
MIYSLLGKLIIIHKSCPLILFKLFFTIEFDQTKKKRENYFRGNLTIIIKIKIIKKFIFIIMNLQNTDINFKLLHLTSDHYITET